MKRILLAAALVCAITVAVPASADVIYDNGTYITSAASFADYSSNFVQADNFTLEAGSETITDIHWWGIYGTTGVVVPDDFSIVIYGDNGGVPDTGNVLLNLSAGDVAQTDTGAIFGSDSSNHIYSYSLDIAPLTLVAGQTYYLAINNNIGYWGWSASGAGTHFADGSAPLGDGFSVAVVQSELAFNLTNDGVVPEPASILLMGLGLGGVAWRARKKRS